jgi:hypothetical protein|tara:strand:- start:582 stop:797 length:216 start_codon:yes stop_codon:yes gene_type:complete
MKFRCAYTEEIQKVYFIYASSEDEAIEIFNYKKKNAELENPLWKVLSSEFDIMEVEELESLLIREPENLLY